MCFCYHRQIAGMAALETLHMSNTKRNINNFPAGLEALANLTGKCRIKYSEASLS